jgi:SAM-dependent methyltransferase
VVVSENEKLERIVQTALQCNEPVYILEAGCGSTSHIQLPANTHVTGIDISERQLARNSSLSEAVHGDLQTHRWPADSFDLVLCWDVLEHLPNPREAIARMTESLRPGGLLVIALPNLYSLKGLITRFTPWWFHKAFYRYVVGDKRSSEEWDQFPTFLRHECSPASILKQGRTARLEVLHYRLYEGPVQTYLRRQHRLADWGFTALGLFSRVLSLGQLDLTHSDCMIVLRRPAA